MDNFNQLPHICAPEKFQVQTLGSCLKSSSKCEDISSIDFLYLRDRRGFFNAIYGVAKDKLKKISLEREDIAPPYNGALSIRPNIPV